MNSHLSIMRNRYGSRTEELIAHNQTIDNLIESHQQPLNQHPRVATIYLDYWWHTCPLWQPQKDSWTPTKPNTYPTLDGSMGQKETIPLIQPKTHLRSTRPKTPPLPSDSKIHVKSPKCKIFHVPIYQNHSFPKTRHSTWKKKEIRNILPRHYLQPLQHKSNWKPYSCAPKLPCPLPIPPWNSAIHTQTNIQILPILKQHTANNQYKIHPKKLQRRSYCNPYWNHPSPNRSTNWNWPN